MADPSCPPHIERRAFLLWSAASAAGLLGCGARGQSCPPPTSGAWQNAACTRFVRPERIVTPESARALLSLIGEAQTAHRRVRMTGTGHSYSDVALTGQILLLPQGLTGQLPLARGELMAPAATDRTLVRVKSGTTIRALNQTLASQGLALQNLGGYDGQTIAGVAMTATHGSGLAFGPIAAQIRSIQIATSPERLVQVEPSMGITDPTRFSKRLAEDPNVSLELVQDDDVFNAVSVSMGCMGIVYSYVLQAVPAYFIRERRELVSWRDLSKPGGYLEAFIARPRDPAFPDHLEVTLSPYARDGDHDCLLTRRARLAQAPVPTPGSQQRGALGNGSLFADPVVREVAEDVLVRLLDGADPTALARIHWAFLDVLRDDEYVAEGYRVFNLGDINRFRVYGIEMAFDLSETIRATERAFDIAAEQARLGRHHSVPITLRFVRAADALLAMQQGRDTMMMEIGMLVAAYQSDELLKTYERVLMQEFRARPHWGLDLDILGSFAQVEALYPFASKWRAVYATFNRSGTFDGQLTDRLGISMAPRTPA